MKTLSLSDLKPGEQAKVLGFKSGNYSYQLRLMAMGLRPDMEFTLVRRAPLGDPIQIRLHHHSLCLRKAESAILQIERI